MKNLLITGGAGFIGSNFIKYMFEQYNEYKIINLDLLTYAGDLNNLKEINYCPNYNFIQGDICDKSLIKNIFSKYKIDYIINFAAESHVDRSIKDSEVFIKTNILGVHNLLEICKNEWQEGTDKKGYPIYKKGVKFIQISTDEVYGDIGLKEKCTETSPIVPSNPYSASKASGELLVKAYYQTYKLPINITRCSNNYGPNQNIEKLIPLMILNALRNKKLPVYGDGMQIRDWIHVKDHCSAIDIILNKGRVGEIYNIGANNEKTNLEIIRLILKTLGKSEELISFVKDRPGHDRRYGIDNSKIVSELKWTPKCKFEKGIMETIDWYRDYFIKTSHF